MYAATHREDDSGINAAYRSIWIHFRQAFQRRAVIGVSKRGDNNRTITHVVIQIAVIDPIIVISKHLRRSDRHNIKTGVRKLCSEFSTVDVVRMLFLRLLMKQDIVIGSKAGHYIHMAPSTVFLIVAVQTTLKPYGTLRTEQRVYLTFNVLLAPVGITPCIKLHSLR